MMSFGGGWFFVAASEAISVLNQKYTLPGIGSYVAAAVAAENLPALGWALLTIAVVIVLVNQLFWRPLIAWADKFRLEQSAASTSPLQVWQEPGTIQRSPYAKPLPHVRVGGISGLLELIVDQPEGRDDIPRLAERIRLAVDDLLPMLDAFVMLGCDAGVF